MQNQDHYSSSLNSNSQRVLVQPPNHLNQSMSSYSFVRYQPTNSVQPMANTSHHSSQPSSFALSSQVQSWNPSCEQLQHLHNQPQTQQQLSQQQQQYQRLKVEDALSYLDQVKLKFGHQPQVYNEFLDIMKEFKSQVIDTPGVIKKVSILFQGHNELIVGFNTFLPQGYSIEVRENETINVRQPGQQVVPLTNFNSSNPAQTQPPPVHQPINQSNQSHNARQTAEIPQNADQFGTNQGQPVQFNHAINYVNKIKSCYQGRPEIYKAFLDILHNYQKEQKNLKEGTRQPGNRAPVTEAEVYAQVSHLFKDQPELLMEFRQFLPDANGGSEFMKGLGVSENVAQHNSDLQPPHLANQTSLASTKATQPSRAGMSLNSPVRSKSSLVTNSLPPTKRQKLSFQKSSPKEQADFADLVCHDSELTKIARRMVSLHPSKESQCRELLKQVDILNKKLADVPEFCRTVNPLLEKMPDFKPHVRVLLSKHEQMHGVDKKANLPALTNKESGRIPDDREWFPDPLSCPQHGKHYRILPADYVGEKSSNRTELCKEVLNETHVICASAMSDAESDGEQTTRRNVYEDHVFQCEDERYELDMVIDVNSNVLRGLKKLMSKMQKMNSEDLSKFQIDDLSTAMGISAVSVETALKRLYGDKYLTMLDGLKKCPGTAAPLIAKSMQLKDADWKLAKKSFERNWAEQMDKYYLKSLDFQGLKFKQNDIKAIRSKSLIKEIENLCNKTDAEKKSSCDADADERSNDGSQDGDHRKRGLRLRCRDRCSYDDAAMLVLGSIGRQSGIQVEDREKIKNVLLNFLPSVLFLTKQKPAKNEVKRERSSEESEGLSCEVKVAANARTKVKVKREIGGDSQENLPNGADLPLGSPQSTPFFCNDNWYVLIRLLVLLCERLRFFQRRTKQLHEEEEVNKRLRSSMMTLALQSRCPDLLDPSSYYATFLGMVKNLTNGLLELSSFEDQLREMFGIDSYVAFTVDKLIQNIIKQLQHVTSKEDCLTLGRYYESVFKHDWSHEQYEQKARDLMSDKPCFKMIVEKDAEGLVDLFYVLMSASPVDSWSPPDKRDPRADSPSSFAPNCPTEVAGKVFSARTTALNQETKERKRRRKLSEVRGHVGSKRLCLTDNTYSFGSMPDFFRKLRRCCGLVGVKHLQRPVATPQNCLVQALETIASSHLDVGASPQPRSDYDNDTRDQCINEESSDGSQKMLPDKDGDKSEDDSSCSGSFRRFALQAGSTEVYVCRPECLGKARKNNWKIHMAKKKRFDKWKNKWSVEHLNEESTSQCQQWLNGAFLSFPVDPQILEKERQKLDASKNLVHPCPLVRSTVQKAAVGSPQDSPKEQSPRPPRSNHQPVESENDLSSS